SPDPIGLGLLAVALTCLMSLLPPLDTAKALVETGISLVACAYLGQTLLGLAYIHALGGDADADLGRVLLAVFLAMVWAGDIGAYFAGSIFGKRKIAPIVSPGKTYAGFFGNLLGCLVIGGLTKVLVLPRLNLVDVIVLTLITWLLG